MKKSLGNSRKGKKTKTKKTSRKRHVSTALILVDQKPFLKKALSKCKRLRNELNKKQKLLSEYEDNDLVAFQQWLSRTFGAKLSKLRTLKETLAEYDYILFNLSNCSIFCPDKLHEIHKELFERKENGTLYQFVPPVATGNPDYDDDEYWDDQEWDDDDKDEEWDDETAEAIFDEIFGSGEQESNSKNEYDFSKAFEPPRKSMSASEESSLKKCYRTLAKRLHPDHSTLEESIREKRWHEIQEAYQNNDLEALMRIEAICDLDGTNLSIEIGLARLTDIANYHQSHIKPIRHALSQAKRDIAFGFAESGPTKEITDEMKFEFDASIQTLESHLKSMQLSIDDLLQEFMERQEIGDTFVAASFGKTKSTQKKHSKSSKSRQAEDDPRQMNLF